MIGELSNSERLQRLYDPHYVRRVDTLDGAPVQVCLESRMLQENAGPGVATYARILAANLSAAGASPLLLDDGSVAGRVSRTRIMRWLSATRMEPRMAEAEPGEGDKEPTQWVVRDVFREAQIFFNLHGRLLPVEFARPPQVMHWTYPVPLYVVGAKNLYTIHDLIPLSDPHLTSISGERHGAILRNIVKHAHALVTVSESIRQQVIECLSVSESFVINSYQAVDVAVRSDSPLPEGLRSGRYFFFCGRVERRKNLERLVRIHAASGTAMPLVIVGPAVVGEEALETLLRTYPQVVRILWVPRIDLLGMMRRARALLFPSLAEGFGLPLAEAMTIGCPVLTSDRGATAEIAGQAALLVDPEQDEAILSAIRRLDSDDMLCARLRAAGFVRGRFFAQGLYARRLRALYAGALTASLRPAHANREGTA